MRINSSEGVNQIGMITKYKAGQDLAVSDKESTDTSSIEEASVTLDISEKSKGRVEVNSFDASTIQKQMEQLREQAAGAEKSGRINSKCMTISRRIAGGDEVPIKDTIYLQKHRPDLYEMAMKMRILKADPEKYDSVLDDEDEDDDTSNNVHSIGDGDEGNIDTSVDVSVEVSESIDTQ